MNAFSWFTARRSTNKPRTTLRVTELEARDVPAAAVPTLDLSTVGSFGSINGAIFRQYDTHAPANVHNGAVQSFLRLNEGGREHGYNTDARPLQFDESRRGTHSIRVDDLPLVTIGGIQYRELVLDVNEPSHHSKISLDELRVFVSDNPKLHGYNNRNDTLGGVRASYDLGAHRWVQIDAGLNHRVGTGDVLVDIPASALTGGTYLALYSKFGVHNGAGGGAEQWGPGFKTDAKTSTISGSVQLFGGPPTLFDTQITLTGSDGTSQQFTVIASSDGTFTFTVPLNQTATYTLTWIAVDHSEYTGGSLTLLPGDPSTGLTLTFSSAG